jgi:hypothetical protein
MVWGHGKSGKRQCPEDGDDFRQDDWIGFRVFSTFSHQREEYRRIGPAATVEIGQVREMSKNRVARGVGVMEVEQKHLTEPAASLPLSLGSDAPGARGRSPAASTHRSDEVPPVAPPAICLRGTLAAHSRDRELGAIHRRGTDPRWPSTPPDESRRGSTFRHPTSRVGRPSPDARSGALLTASGGRQSKYPTVHPATAGMPVACHRATTPAIARHPDRGAVDQFRSG